MALPTDTSREAEKVLADVYRRMSPARKLALLDDAWLGARQMHAAGHRLRHPQARPADVQANWLATLGAKTTAITEIVMDQASELSARVLDVIRILDRLGIRYALGGSMASSIHGKPRFTQDADLTVEPFAGQERVFAESFDASYYVSLDAVERAVRDRTSFNVIHTSSGFKLDLFVRKDTPFEDSVYARRLQAPLTSEAIYVVSPEDIILYKLDWYRVGGFASERQWNDVLGVLQVQGERLDLAYLEHWANQLGVADLLTKARAEASTDP
jgi:hypothetical protein